MGSEQWEVRTIQVARNQQSAAKFDGLQRSPELNAHTHTHTHIHRRTFRLLGLSYINICLQRSGLVWSHGQKCSDWTSSSISAAFFCSSPSSPQACLRSCLSLLCETGPGCAPAVVRRKWRMQRGILEIEGSGAWLLWPLCGCWESRAGSASSSLWLHFNDKYFFNQAGGSDFLLLQCNNTPQVEMIWPDRLSSV